MDVSSSETRTRPASSPSAAPGGFAPGTILASRYRIVSLAGRGGMGEVYRADDLRLGQPVALKFLPASLEQDASARERLLAEVRHARTVSHPNVCRVYDVGDVEGRVFLTMEYIDGEDLASLLRRIGKLPAAKALEVARQLCAGLAAAHDKGLLHRDLKPANVMIDGRGHARITDFGLALEAASAESVPDYAGTLAYMAPERFAGKPATVQSDLYALGLILYETYTGRAAFKAGSVLEWQQVHSDSAPTRPSELAADVEPVVERAILRCLEKEPASRPSSAGQVAAALPGGDPLAAAIAAGETPSPELIAASGEEGTLPRWQAWAWLAACLAALAIWPFVRAPFLLTEHLQMASPEVLQVRARDIIRKLGYTEPAADSAWWFTADDRYLERLKQRRPSEALAELRAAPPWPLLFYYRQSPYRLVPWGTGSAVSAFNPPASPGNILVAMDLQGRLAGLLAQPADDGDARPSSRVDWDALCSAAGLGPPSAFAAAAPKWWPRGATDAREAREGVFAGEKVHLEAAVRDGKPILFYLLPPWAPEPWLRWAAPSVGQEAPRAVQAVVNAVTLAVLLALALLARRNIRLGRGSRTGARRLAVGIALLVALSVMLNSDALPSGIEIANAARFGLFTGVVMWLAYMGCEPWVRRVWPRLLIGSTRLLEGRWRDPLVGRALLTGILAGPFLLGSLVAPVARLLDRSGGELFEVVGVGGTATFLARQAEAAAMGGPILGLIVLGLLFLLRLLVRRDWLAWAGAGILLFVFFFAASTSTFPVIGILLPLAEASLAATLILLLLWRHGVLGLTVAGLVGSLLMACPWTLDMSRWYAWRQSAVSALIVGLALWGFRNVLGRQSAFPAGALDG